IPNWFAEREPGQAPPAPIVKGLETGLMPAMDEGSITVDFFAPAGTPLKRTVELAKKIEEILMENPDVDAYVRRAGTEVGIFATKTNGGDIQVAIRPAEDDLWSVLAKPVRPEFSKIEDELKKEGGRENIRKRYRRRPILAVKTEIEDEIKEHFTE